MAYPEPEPKRSSPDATVVAFLQATFGASVRQLVLSEPVIVRSADLEAIHQARVATRRLRSNLKTFGSLLAKEPATRLRDELAWFGALLGAVRDAQVLGLFLAGWGASTEGSGSTEPDGGSDVGGLVALIDAAAAQAQSSHQMLVAEMRTERFAVLMTELVRVAEDPPVVSIEVGSQLAAEAVGRLVRRGWKRLRRSVESTTRSATDGELHEFRKQLKRVRYAVQAARPLRIGAKPFRRELAAAQDLLGELNDLRVQREYLVGEVGRLDPWTAYRVGQLTRDLDQRRFEIRSQWPEFADRLARLDVLSEGAPS